MDVALGTTGSACHTLASRALYALFGLDPRNTPVTSFTIGIATPEETLAKVAETGDHSVLKVKIGAGSIDEQVEIVRLIRERFSGTLRLDANEGWTPESAVRNSYDG